MSERPERPLSTAWAHKNLFALRDALDHHNAACEHRAEAFLLNPYDHGLLRLGVLWGVPVLPDESLPAKEFRIRCSAPEPDEVGVLPADEHSADAVSATG